VLAVLRRDLANATGVQPIAAGGVALGGHAALARAALEVAHRPARVTYAVRTIGRRQWLVREQADADGGRWAELVCDGVQSFRVSPQSAARPGAADGKAVTDAGPASYRLVLRWTSASRPALDETIDLR
jgi:hypothetical protein